MKFMTYNIQFGRGLDGIYDLDRIARTVESADVIALQEVERYFPRSGYVDQVKELAPASEVPSLGIRLPVLTSLPMKFSRTVRWCIGDNSLATCCCREAPSLHRATTCCPNMVRSVR